MQRYIESSASTISTLTKKLEILDAKVANSETNYIVALKKINELENENKELRKVCSAALEKIGFLEVCKNFFVSIYRFHMLYRFMIWFIY